MSDPWASVVGQDRAVAQLRAAVDNPAHAYLFVGPPGSGRRAAAQVFAGELLAAGFEGDAAERHRQLARTEQHPDLTVVERKGAFIAVGEPPNPEEGSARWVVQRAPLSPVDARRSVFVLLDFHLVQRAGPVLLKTIEEPPAHVFFIVVADEVNPDLVTIASRCVPIEFGAVPVEVMAEILQREGASAEVAATAAAGSLGSIDRARLLVVDERFALRREGWAAVPDRLDGTGSTAATVAAELAAMLDDAQSPLDARHRRELEELANREAVSGQRGSGRRDMEARHRREVRRLRTDELRFGFATLAERYRDQLVSGRDARQALAALDALARASEALDRNPNEMLQLQALLVRLGHQD